jgi:hypothetical protein
LFVQPSLFAFNFDDKKLLCMSEASLEAHFIFVWGNGIYLNVYKKNIQELEHLENHGKFNFNHGFKLTSSRFDLWNLISQTFA